MAEQKPKARRSAWATNSAVATKAWAHEPFGDGPPTDEVLRHMPCGSALPLGTEFLDVGDLVSAEFCIDGVPSRVPAKDGVFFFAESPLNDEGG